MKDTIIVIGNGFDKWQGLKTGYGDFRKYYLENRKKVCDQLKINPIFYSEGRTDVELIYGESFGTKELEDVFWSDVEAALGKIDVERIMFSFESDDEEVEELKERIFNGYKIFSTLFCNWVESINVAETDAGYRFGDNCIFINFNYTDTLIKRFHVRPSDEFHIHGSADEKESIIVGHTTHPDPPYIGIARLGGRLEMLYHFEELLYYTNKDTEICRFDLLNFLKKHEIMPGEIKNVYFFGKAMTETDIDYIKFLAAFTKNHIEINKCYGKKEKSASLDSETVKWHISCYREEDKKQAEQTMKLIQNNNYSLYSSIDECIMPFRCK